MKKIILFILCLFPINVFAYSKYVIPGGDTLGIEIKSNGVMIIGFYKVGGKYNKGTTELRSGDYIIKVNDTEVNTVAELTSEIEKNVGIETVELTFKRNNKEKKTNLKLIETDGIYKTGLYVKDSITGTGTLSYIDPVTKIYGALGHEIIESNSNSLVEIRTGTIFQNSITSIDKSTNGSPGSKNARFEYDNIYGTVFKNTSYGIYGKYTKELPNKELMEVIDSDDIKIGKATILTVLENEEIKPYEINITAINKTNKIKNITFEITDKELLEKTGGVVQGMSGSPIIQNNKIIGAVTHVVIDNVTHGYGIFITTMLKEGEN